MNEDPVKRFMGFCSFNAATTMWAVAKYVAEGVESLLIIRARSQKDKVREKDFLGPTCHCGCLPHIGS